VGPSAKLTCIRHGENTTYRVDGASRSIALRIARPGYQTTAAIRSEIAWMDALREDGIQTPAAVPGRDGDVVQELVTRNGDVQVAVAFEWIDGVPLPDVDGLDAWNQLGEIMARIHDHAGSWDAPSGFMRPAWDADALVGDSPRWGTPCPSGVWAEDDRALILAAREAARNRLASLADSPQRFGLIHADLGFENVLVRRGGATVVIDFDDSGPSWHLYDLASVLYPLEGSPSFGERRDALVDGYRRVRGLADEELAELPTFLMCRRLATLGWTFSRSETAHAQRQRSRRLRTSPGAARKFLDWHAQRARSGVLT
jgi:Ser/Thr protein kinase RdoA (MazF antagonist)